MLPDFWLWIMWPFSTLLNFALLVLCLLALLEQISWGAVGKTSAVFLLLSFAEGYLRGAALRRALEGPTPEVMPEPKPDPLASLALLADGYLCEAEAAYDQGNLREAVEAYRQFGSSVESLREKGWNMQQLREFLSNVGSSRSFKDRDYYEALRTEVKAFCQ